MPLDSQNSTRNSCSPTKRTTFFMKWKSHFREGTKSPKEEPWIRKPIPRLQSRKCPGKHSREHPKLQSRSIFCSGTFVLWHLKILMNQWLVLLGVPIMVFIFIWHDTAWHGVVSVYDMDVGSVCDGGIYLSSVSGYRGLILEEILRPWTSNLMP